MAKDKLFVSDDDHRGYRIVWFLGEEGDEGATIGDGDKTYTDADLAKSPPSEREHVIACMPAKKSDGAQRDGRGFYWETRAKAQAALKLINLAIKTDGGAPWPEWALKANAEGWKEPKGWKPS